MTPIVAFSGPSGAGKTRLLVRLLRALAGRGLRVAALKHSRHPHPFDTPGKDSHRLRRAGALAVAVEGPAGAAWFGPPLGGARAMARLLPAVDLVVAEGFKAERLPRVEVHARRVSKEFLCVRDRRVMAVVSDEPPPRALPCFAHGEVEALADFLCRRFGLGASSGGERSSGAVSRRRASAAGRRGGPNGADGPGRAAKRASRVRHR